jgi:formate--tetrahydrofolate ligase
VSYTAEAAAKLKEMEADPKTSEMGTCMVKTHLSLSHEPTLKGVPKGWTLPIRDILTFGGAGFVVPVAGTISLMPGTSATPAYMNVDVDTETGKVKGLF